MGKDGRRIAVSLSMSPLKNARGEVVGSAAIARDITQRLQAEEALRQSEEKYRSIVLNIPDVVWTVDSRGRIVFVSPNIERLGGYTAEEVCQGGLDLLFETMHPDDVQTMKETLEAAFRDQQPREVEYRGRCKDGRWIWVRARAMGAYEKDGVQYLQGLLSDITERKRAEEELALLKHSIDVYYDGAYWTDLDNRLIYVNDAGCKALGYEREELIGKTVNDVIPQASPETLKRVWESLHSQGFFSMETVHRRKNGSEFPVELVITYVQFAGKEFACGIARDITERKRAEKALRESEQFNREVIANAQEGVVVYDREFRYQVWNRFMEELTGVPASETLGKHGFDLFPHLREQSVDLLIRRALAGEVVHAPDMPFQVPATGKSGWVSSVYSPHFGASGEILGVIGIIRDITERKRVEAALRDSEQRYREFIARSIEAVWRIELDHPIPANLPQKELVAQILQLGYVAECNDALARQLGFSRAGEIIGKHLGEWIQDADEERLATFLLGGSRQFSNPNGHPQNHGCGGQSPLPAANGNAGGSGWHAHPRVGNHSRYHRAAAGRRGAQGKRGALPEPF